MQSQSPITSTMGVVFSLTTTGRWNGSQIKEAARNIRLTYDGSALVMASRATGEPLAILRYNAYQSTVGELQRIDMGLCGAIEPDMGGWLVGTLEALRDELDCVICDPDGVEMLPTELQAAADAIDAMAARHIEASRLKPQRLPDGSMRVPGALSFIHTTTTARGRWLDATYFDTKPMDYSEGQQTGMRMAGELLAYIKAHKTKPLPVVQIIAAAMGCELPISTWAKPSTANISRAFLDVLVEMVEAAARHLDHETYIERAIKRLSDDDRDAAEWEVERHKRAAMKAAVARKARSAAKAAA